jgi:hypothetical protein
MVFSVFAIARPFGFYSDAVTHLSGKGDAVDFVARCAGPAIALVMYWLLVRTGEARPPSEIAPASPYRNCSWEGSSGPPCSR